ncbi:MAG: hypothetical protein WC413_00180 [Candidatus Nanoarchaeia archaeon]
MLPKILVGCPTSIHKEYCFDKYLKGIKDLTYKNFDVLLVDNSDTLDYYNKIKDKINTIRFEPKMINVRYKLAESRNLIVDKVLKEGYDYFLSLEQDIVPPTDIIERLLKHNKEIICGVYYNYFNTHPPGIKPVLFKKFNQEDLNNLLKSDDINYAATKKEVIEKNIKDPSLIRTRFTNEELQEPRLIEVYKTGLGCILIHRSILEKVRFKWDLKLEAFDDFLFCEDVQREGHKIFCDTSMKCMHYPMPWEGIIK